MIDYKKKMTIGKAKKILRGFLAKDCYIETPLYYAIPYLLDYITNLQEIEKDHQRINGELRQQLKQTEELAMEYKTRNDKAIEYINENWGHWCSNHCKYATETINILQGSDKE